MPNIESGIKMPNICKQKIKGENKHGFHLLEVGQSMFFSGYHSTQGCSEYTSAMAYGKKTNKRFVGRAMDGGVRVWRVE